MTFDDLFTLTATGSDQWTAPGAPATDERVVFGGLVVGQAVMAVSQETRRCHALHAFFIGGGDKQRTFEIKVERTRDGGTFATRQFQIRQGERLLLAGYSSHHDGNEGPEHQIAMPDAPGPETLTSNDVMLRMLDAQGGPRRHYLADEVLEIRQRDRSDLPSATGAAHVMWFRSRTPIQGGDAVHQAAIAFASDVGLVRAGLLPHARTQSAALQVASLDHSIWFHREAQVDGDWMLYVMQSPILRHGRGLSYGAIFTRTGELVASVAQEFLARIPSK